MKRTLTLALSLSTLAVQAQSPAQKMAASVIQQWPAGVITTIKGPGTWGYEEGTLLDGMAAEWQQTGDGADFAYIKASVDKYVDKDGNIKGYKAEGHTLDDVEMGRAVMLLYRVTLDAKYYKAAKFLHAQLELQPRGPSGAYWHKQIYPNQVWLDGAYMAEPFRAAYAKYFQVPGDYDDIAKQLLTIDKNMRDPKTGLLKHGWDESKTMEWADKTTGLSPSYWGRAMGWYCMALVDTLDFFPADHPQRAAIVAVLNRTMTQVAALQDKPTGLWWQVLDKPGAKGNFLEASASEMFVYATAKGVRLGYLPQTLEPVAKRGWEGIQKQFIKTSPEGMVTLTGTVKVGGLGGKPYRSGTYDYYVGETVGDQDAKGVGAYLLAGSEAEQFATEALDQKKVVLMDNWFNHQTRTNPAGQSEVFHYKWDDDSNNGFSLVGHVFQRFGAKLATLPAAPTSANLAKASIYFIVSPDIPSKNPNPNYMDKASADAIETWVKGGGVLMLMMNDKNNTEFEHMNTLSERFGIHFNPVDRNIVKGEEYEMGRLDIPANEVFAHPHQAHMKEICTITTSGPAKPVYIDKGDTIIAVAKVGKGTVFAVTDPWIYNEYADGRKLPPAFDTFSTTIDLAAWALKTAK
jgi:unsaturated rhamnogalacturonyl hydrolase